MKRILALMLALLLVFATFMACESEEKENETGEKAETDESTVDSGKESEIESKNDGETESEIGLETEFESESLTDSNEPEDKATEIGGTETENATAQTQTGASIETEASDTEPESKETEAEGEVNDDSRLMRLVPEMMEKDVWQEKVVDIVEANATQEDIRDFDRLGLKEVRLHDDPKTNAGKLMNQNYLTKYPQLQRVNADGTVENITLVVSEYLSPKELRMLGGIIEKYCPEFTYEFLENYYQQMNYVPTRTYA